MSFIDKRGLMSEISEMNFVSLELGCGPRKLKTDSIGIDMLDYDGVDLVGDVYEILSELPPNVVDTVHSSHFVEHVADFPLLLSELARIMKVGGKLTIVVPHFSNPHFYSDLTHKLFFGLYSMSYFANEKLLQRRVPTYQRDVNFTVDSIYLVFKSSRPFYVRHAFKKMIEFFVNLNSYTKELYEEMFCYLFPCYEIRYELRRTV